MGGDVDTYLAALQRVDDEFHLAPAGTATIGVHRDPSVRARAARAARGVRSTVHRALSHLPRRWRPGPTYHDL